MKPIPEFTQNPEETQRQELRKEKRRKLKNFYLLIFN